jgi:hypothetical protein
MVAKGTQSSPDEKYRTEEDARHLERAAEVRADAKRHKAAMKHLKGKMGSLKGAMDMETKVKKGLAAAFPKDASSESEGVCNA